MARILCSHNGRDELLSSVTVVGRDENAAIRMAEELVSNNHAEIRWSGDAWQLKDLGSTNGTWVNRRRIDPGKQITLKEQDRISFGDPDNEWVLTDASAPLAAIELGSNRVRSARNDILLLPSDETPLVTVHLSADSNDWILDTGEETRTVEHGEKIQVGSRIWQLQLPKPTTQTLRGDTVSVLNAAGEFTVDPTGEHIALVVRFEDRETEVPQRSHHEILLRLAEQRIADESAQPPLPESEQGWIDIDLLCDMVKQTKRRINVHVFRARSQMAELSVHDPAEIIQRRDHAGTLRIGLGNLRIKQT